METTAIRLLVKKSALGAGDGLFARAPFKKGEFVIEYTGKKIPTKAADASHSRYLFELDEDWTIDAQGEENTARYINHSCHPNCESDIVDGKILISALRDIPEGEELTFDYGEEYFDEFIRPVGCKCGSIRCRSTLASKPSI